MLKCSGNSSLIKAKKWLEEEDQKTQAYRRKGHNLA